MQHVAIDLGGRISKSVAIAPPRGANAIGRWGARVNGRCTPVAQRVNFGGSLTTPGTPR